MITADAVRALDAGDPLAPYRALFHLPGGLIYLDGNSLGLMPTRVRARMAEVVEREWGDGLIGSWTAADWINLPLRAGDRIAPLIGARPGEVVVGDSTSVNLFKCLCAALQQRPDRTAIVTEADNFPTDNYIIQGVADLLPRYQIRAAASTDELGAFIDATAAVVLLTHVNYRTAAMHDLAAVTRAAHAAGALMIWDLSHSVGAMPLDMAGADVDFAVGCTYKYLNGGPGAPAFTYVAPRLAGSVRQPLSGWMGHQRPFDFSGAYRPGDGARRFLSGTPQILSLVALAESLAVWDGVDLAAVRRKSEALTDLFIALVDQECGGLGLAVASPRGAGRRGSHVSVACDVGYPVIRALAERGVVGDFRAPNLMRFGLVPLYTSYRDVFAAVGALREVLTAESWRAPRFATKLEVT